MNQQRGAWYYEMIALYDRFVEGNLDHHYTSYFTELQVYFREGELITKIHALELILNIVLGGKWTGFGSRPKSVKQDEIIDEVENTEVSNKEIPIETIIKWLEEVLPREEDGNVLKVYFIFIKTHWEHLLAESPYFSRLYKLHKKLLHNKGYGKLELLEQLHKNAFSERYRILR